MGGKEAGRGGGEGKGVLFQGPFLRKFSLFSPNGKSHLQRTAHTPNIAATATDARLVKSIRHSADQKRPASSSSLLSPPFFTSSFSSTKGLPVKIYANKKIYLYSKLSAIDLTAKAVCERLVLVPGWRSEAKTLLEFVTMPSARPHSHRSIRSYFSNPLTFSDIVISMTSFLIGGKPCLFFVPREILIIESRVIWTFWYLYVHTDANLSTFEHHQSNSGSTRSYKVMDESFAHAEQLLMCLSRLGARLSSTVIYLKKGYCSKD